MMITSGALPIAFGLDAGSKLRQPLCINLIGCLLFSQVITLFITPLIYLYLDRYSCNDPLKLQGDKIPVGTRCFAHATHQETP